MLEQIAQRGGRCHIPGNIQGWVGQDSKKPGVVEDGPAYCKGGGLAELQRFLSAKTGFSLNSDEQKVRSHFLDLLGKFVCIVAQGAIGLLHCEGA